MFTATSRLASRRVLKAHKDRYPDLAIYITESGMADDGEPDGKRSRYLAGVLKAVSDAIHSGVDVSGYTYWSLIDNFEWAEGFRPRFGLARVDYDTLQRSLKGTRSLPNERIPMPLPFLGTPVDDPTRYVLCAASSTLIRTVATRHRDSKPASPRSAVPT